MLFLGIPRELLLHCQRQQKHLGRTVYFTVVDQKYASSYKYIYIQLKLGSAPSNPEIPFTELGQSLQITAVWYQRQSVFQRDNRDPFQSVSVPNRVLKPLSVLLCLPCPPMCTPQTSQCGFSFVCWPFSRRARWKSWKVFCQYFCAAKVSADEWNEWMEAAANNVIRVSCSSKSS